VGGNWIKTNQWYGSIFQKINKNFNSFLNKKENRCSLMAEHPLILTCGRNWIETDQWYGSIFQKIKKSFNSFLIKRKSVVA
jgi:hypothetical protein